MAEKRKIFIETPKGVIKEVTHKNGKIGLKLVWNKNFDRTRNRELENVQEYVDSECIRFMKPYTPMRTGLLYKSADLGTPVGSGEIKQVAPYARYLYYGEVYGPNIPKFENGELVGFVSPPKKHPTGRELQYDKTAHPQAGKLWFERMKADHKDAILQGAAKKAGGKAK